MWDTHALREPLLCSALATNRSSLAFRAQAAAHHLVSRARRRVERGATAAITLIYGGVSSILPGAEIVDALARWVEEPSCHTTSRAEEPSLQPSPQPSLQLVVRGNGPLAGESRKRTARRNRELAAAVQRWPAAAWWDVEAILHRYSPLGTDGSKCGCHFARKPYRLPWAWIEGKANLRLVWQLGTLLPCLLPEPNRSRARPLVAEWTRGWARNASTFQASYERTEPEGSRPRRDGAATVSVAAGRRGA